MSDSHDGKCCTAILSSEHVCVVVSLLWMYNYVCASQVLKLWSLQAVEQGTFLMTVTSQMDYLNMSSLISCIMPVTPATQVSDCPYFHQNIKCLCEIWPFFSLCFLLVLRKSIVLHHRTVPADADSSACRSGQSDCSAATAWSKPTRPTCGQRGFPLHHEGMDHSVHSEQASLKTSCSNSFLSHAKTFEWINELHFYKTD